MKGAIMKVLIATLVTAAWGIVLVGCGSNVATSPTAIPSDPGTAPAPGVASSIAKCRAAAEDVYREYLKAGTYEEVRAIGAATSGRLDALPECADLTNRQSSKLEKELEDGELFKEALVHIIKLKHDGSHDR